MAGRLLARVPVIPFYNQVSIGDHKDTAVPEWGEGSSTAGYSASGTRLIVATCNDTDGHVVVDIRDGAPSDDYGTSIYSGALTFNSQTLSVGSVTAEPSRVLFFPRIAEWNIHVYVDPPQLARHVVVVIENYDDPDMPDSAWMHI